MRGLLTLEQELRALRTVKGQKNANQSNHPPAPKESERPWQLDIDQVHQTMRELLRVISSLSGVELPGLPPGLQDDGAPPPRLDIKNLKDRFRHDLEGFSIKTTEELTKRAKEQTHAALDALQSEVGGRIDHVAAEFRKQLELPAQVEKLVGPSVEEAAARLESSFSQKVEQLSAEQERVAQERLQEALSPVQARINTVEEAAARLERSLSQKVEQLFAEQEQLVRERLQEALTPVQAQIRTLEETVRQIRELKADSVVQLPAQWPDAAVDNTTKKYENRLNNEPDRGLDQVCKLKADSVAQLPAQRPDAAVDNTTEEYKGRPNNEVDRGLDQAFSRIKWSFKDILETFKIQPAQSTSTGPEGQRRAILSNDIETQSRVEQALENLGRLGSKNPHAASKAESPKPTP